MQPLKRFTQCGSLTMLFVVFIILFGVSSTALTTFGKTNNNVPQTPRPPVLKGRECKTQADCSSLQNTSCVKDPTDYRLRCLCGDNLAPINGLCSSKYKSLRHTCNDVIKCDEGMLCSSENSTKPITFNTLGNKNNSMGMKICLCDEENGYFEDIDDHVCSDAIKVVTSSSYMYLLIFATSLLARRYNQF